MKAQRLAIRLLGHFSLYSALTFAFFLLSLQFMEFENGVYLRYLKSILQDFDFNIINQFSNPLDRWMVTPNYNHPDHRSPFVSVLLFLPYLLANGILTPWQEHFIQQSHHYVFFVAYLMSFVVIQKMESTLGADYKKMLGLSFLSSVGLWYFLFDPGEISLLCIPLSTFIFLKLFFTEEKTLSIKIQILTALALFFLIKPDAVFWLLPIAVVVFSTGDKRFIAWSGALFLISFIILYTTNLSRLGSETVTLPVFQLEIWRPHLILFGAVGLFKYTPAFFFAYLALIVGSLFHSGKWRQASLFCLAVITLKIITLGFIVSDNLDTFAGRSFLTEMPLWAFGYFLIWSYSKRLAMVIILFSLFRSFYHLEIILADWTRHWHLLEEVYYISRRSFFSFEGLTIFWHGPWRFYEYRFSYYDYYILRRVIFVCLLTGGLMAVISEVRFKRMTKYLLGILASLVLIFFTSNLIFNTQNVNKLRANGFFNETVVAKNEALHYDEFLDIINTIEFMSSILATPSKNYTDKLREDFLVKVEENIVHDPTQFLKQLKKRQIRPSFWQLK